MRIVVTGGAGFVGRHVVKSLADKGHNVIIFDNFSNSSKDQISYLIKYGIKVIQGDITNQFEINDAIKNADIVIHLAAKISVNDSIKNPLETFRVNVDGTRNVLNSCYNNKIRKLIISSSAAVYGDAGSSNIKLTEESNTNPISPYGQSKLKMEKEVNEFIYNQSIDVIILRFFNIYGKGQSDEYAGVITKFIERIRKNSPLVIFGDGLQTRDFVAIDDVVKSIHDSIAKSGGNGMIYNIASGKAITIKELAEIMILISGKEIIIKYLPSKKGDIKFSQASIAFAKKELGYSPKTKLSEGIKNLLDSEPYFEH